MEMMHHTEVRSPSIMMEVHVDVRSLTVIMDVRSPSVTMNVKSPSVMMEGKNKSLTTTVYFTI